MEWGNTQTRTHLHFQLSQMVYLRLLFINQLTIKPCLHKPNIYVLPYFFLELAFFTAAQKNELRKKKKMTTSRWTTTSIRKKKKNKIS